MAIFVAIMISLSTFPLSASLFNIHWQNSDAQAAGSSSPTIEPLQVSSDTITRTVTYPVLQAQGESQPSTITQTMTWYTNGTLGVADSRGYSYRISSIPTSTTTTTNTNATVPQGSSFSLLQNSTMVDQKVVTSTGLQYDVYWKAVQNENGYADRYKFTIVGTSPSPSKISLHVSTDQYIILQEDGFLTSFSTVPTSDKSELLPFISKFSNSTVIGLGIDWSDAVTSGYKMAFNSTSSSIEVPVENSSSFSIDPTTVASITSSVSPSSSDYYQGQRRLAQFDGVLFAFFYDAANQNLAYRTSTDDGATWSSTTDVSTGQMATDTNTWTIVYSTPDDIINRITLFYGVPSGSTTNVYAKRGTVSGSSITWNNATLLFSATNDVQCGAGICLSPAANTDTTNANIFAEFRWFTGSAWNYKILKSTDGGLTWSTSLNTVSPGYGTRFPSILGKLESGKMLFAFARYDASEFYYRTYDGTSWSAVSVTSGAGMANPSIKQISSDGDSLQTVYVAYLTGGNSGSLKIAKWYGNGTFQSFETADSTLSHALPSLTTTEYDVIHAYSLSGGKVYDTRNVDGSWLAPLNPFGTSFTSPDQLTSAISKAAALWEEGTSSPWDLRIGVNPEWDSSTGYQVSTDTNNQNEPTIAVRTTNASQIVVGANNINRSTDVLNCTIYQSQNGGTTWSMRTHLSKQNATDYMSDPVVTSSENGNFYFTCVEIPKGHGNNYYIRLGTSTDGGLTWTNVTTAFSTSTSGADKPWIAADAGGQFAICK
ncbi:sialidase family protein [Candidatus Nitrososphaera evergladensis]|uniref:sialidase family protein n=1 Tax=Candidatus Nitrososphaera evergladensis TaxID=1459637 RepID=UPI0011E5C1DC|nr:sialidase family protein [Candidatus Nitrososphaera evergladensis]